MGRIRREFCIVDGVRHWNCTLCREWLSENKFGKIRSGCGVPSGCKICLRVYNKDRLLRQRGGVHRQVIDTTVSKETKRQAASLLNRAINRGDVKRPGICSKCPRTLDVIGHHHDYSKPLEVEWLCSRCHGKAHWVLVLPYPKEWE